LYTWLNKPTIQAAETEAQLAGVMGARDLAWAHRQLHWLHQQRTPEPARGPAYRAGIALVWAAGRCSPAGIGIDAGLSFFSAHFARTAKSRPDLMVTD